MTNFFVSIYMFLTTSYHFPQSHNIYPLQLDFIGVIENIESLFIGVFSILLLFLSVSTYKRTGLKNILFAAGAFGLFSFDVFLELIVERYYAVSYPMQDLLHTSITLAILTLFFMSIIRNVRLPSLSKQDDD